jgi:dihydropyrimidine dehydrogenase (NADP+)
VTDPSPIHPPIPHHHPAARATTRAARVPPHRPSITATRAAPPSSRATTRAARVPSRPSSSSSTTTTCAAPPSSRAAASSPDPSIPLIAGVPADGPSLAVTLPSGLRLPNPFITGSGPPGTNYQVMAKAFKCGWGGVVAKTVSLDASAVVNVSPRYVKVKAGDGTGALLGWENIELISDRPLQAMLDDFARLKDEFPTQLLIASLMEAPDAPDAWVELVEKCEAAGVDAFEINFGCPHGMPERRMGMVQVRWREGGRGEAWVDGRRAARSRSLSPHTAKNQKLKTKKPSHPQGQDPALVSQITGWVTAATSLPVWAKLTPNVTDVVLPGRAALDAGAAGLAAINTISCVTVDLDTLLPSPTVHGASTQGGYSGPAVKPIALAQVARLARLAEGYQGGRDISGMGGVDTGGDAAEFLLLGAHCVQVCTAVMVRGYPLAGVLAGGLQAFMARHGFGSIEDFRGRALPALTSHAELVARQRGGGEKAKAAGPVGKDADWRGDEFVAQSEGLVSNKG